jgi:hypothetical protein
LAKKNYPKRLPLFWLLQIPKEALLAKNRSIWSPCLLEIKILAEIISIFQEAFERSSTYFVSRLKISSHEQF